MRQARARALDLAQAGFATQLGDDLGDLRGARGADGMPLGLEAARRVDGELAAEAGPTLLRREASSAGLEEAEPFRGNDLGDGEAVVQLDDIHVGGGLARLTVGAGGRPFRRRYP